MQLDANAYVSPEVHCGHQASFIIIIFIVVSIKEMSQECVMSFIHLPDLLNI